MIFVSVWASECVHTYVYADQRVVYVLLVLVSVSLSVSLSVSVSVFVIGVVDVIEGGERTSRWSCDAAHRGICSFLF